MNLKYQLKNGQILEGFVWDDMLNPKDTWCRGNFTIKNLTKKTKNIHRDIFRDEDGNVFFKYSNEIVYIKDFICPSYEDVCDKINSKQYIYSDDMLASFIRYPEKIVIVDSLYLFDFIVSDLGLVSVGDKEITTVCIPKIDGRYNVCDWNYKIQFHAEKESIKKSTSPNTYYFSDFYNSLLMENIKLFKTKEDAEEYVNNLCKKANQK